MAYSLAGLHTPDQRMPAADLTWPALLLRNAGALAHRIPARKLVRHMLAERLGRGALHHHARLSEPRLHVFLGDNRIERLVELGNDRTRRSARREKTVPRGDVVAGEHARFDGGGNGRYCGKAILASDSERLELPGRNVA